MSNPTIIIQDEDEFEDGEVDLTLNGFGEIEAVLAYLRNWLLSDKLGAVEMSSDIMTFRVMEEPDGIVDQIGPAVREAWKEVMSEVGLDDIFLIRDHIDDCGIDKEDPDDLANCVLSIIHMNGGDPEWMLEDAMKRQFAERLEDLQEEGEGDDE